MEEVDRILIRALAQTGSAIPEDVESIKQFSTELIVEAVVRCLRIIEPSLGNSISHLLPPGMSARFRIGMSLAQACQDLGYEGEIGYQTFLYSNEPEIRRLLMFLVEKLPRDSMDSAHQPAGKSAVLQRSISSQIKQQLSAPWVPPSLRTPSLLWTQSSRLMRKFRAQPLSLPENDPTGKRTLKEVKEYYERYLPPVSAQLCHQHSVAASLLERTAADVSAVQEWEMEWNSQGLMSRLSPEEYKARKGQRLQKRIQEHFQQTVQHGFGAQSSLPSDPDLTRILQSYSTAKAGTDSKGSRFTHTEKFTFTQEAEQMVLQMEVAGNTLSSSREPEEDVKAHQEEEVRSLQQQLEQVTRSFEEVAQDMKHLMVNITQVEEESGVLEQTNKGKEELVRVKRRTLELLPDADNNLLKLQGVIESSAQRIVNLANQWEKHRVPLIEQQRRLRAFINNREVESAQKLLEIKGIHEKIKQSAEEVKRKEVLYKQLLIEYESLPKEVSRAAYTHRIMEIVENIKKQKEEITKILSDTKELQKEINNLTGKLERTFAVTDELVFKDAKRDEAVRKAYKYLAALHENCSHLIQTIEDTGTIMREVRDLEEQIESEMGKKTLSNLEKILADYTAIRQDNAALLMKLKDS
ncbi:coiled-coil domain-containing protein 22 [Carcharodon carcharias]|uniref:coiled-coil domain-containing protein 22 n=1 Tax=Carcharodon carcharias TaxID=13397 RepID=UPI001B7E0DDC|nr:coiled-coil domain-containing protein 22 [Carcharodon carcharias]